MAGRGEHQPISDAKLHKLIRVAKRLLIKKAGCDLAGPDK